jgi:hypothetical protein
MPITEKNGKWYWGEKGPYNTKEAAQRVATAAYLSGYKKKTGVMPKKKPYRGKFIRDGKIIRKVEDPKEKSKQWLIDTVEREYPQVTNLKFGERTKVFGDDGSYILFDCHDLEWKVSLGTIEWSKKKPFHLYGYRVCVMSDNIEAAVYDHLLTRISIVANKNFAVVDILEFAWEMYKLDENYPSLTPLTGMYYSPINTSKDFYWAYKNYKGIAHWASKNYYPLGNISHEYIKERGQAAKEKIEYIRDTFQQIFGRELK